MCLCVSVCVRSVSSCLVFPEMSLAFYTLQRVQYIDYILLCLFASPPLLLFPLLRHALAQRAFVLSLNASKYARQAVLDARAKKKQLKARRQHKEVSITRKESNHALPISLVSSLAYHPLLRRCPTGSSRSGISAQEQGAQGQWTSSRSCSQGRGRNWPH